MTITNAAMNIDNEHPADVMAMVGREMSTRQRMFCEEFLANGLDGAKAAAATGYREEGAGRQARKLLSIPIVKAHIETELRVVRDQYWLRREQLLEKMRRLNDFNLMTVVSRSGAGWLEINVNDYDRVAAQIGDCVTEVEVKDNGSVRIKLMDKDRNFDRELKYHGVMDLDGNVNVQINNDNRVADQSINWDEMCEPPMDGADSIEARIIDAGLPTLAATKTQIDEAW